MIFSVVTHRPAPRKTPPSPPPPPAPQTPQTSTTPPPPPPCRSRTASSRHSRIRLHTTYVRRSDSRCPRAYAARRSIDWHRSLPKVRCDRAVRQVFVICSAIRSSTRACGAAPGRLGLAEAGEKPYRPDNGVGFDMRIQQAVRRVPAPAPPQRIRVGLRNVNRIVERHGGRICGSRRFALSSDAVASRSARNSNGRRQWRSAAQIASISSLGFPCRCLPAILSLSIH